MMYRRSFVVTAIAAVASPARAQEPAFAVGQIWSLVAPMSPQARIRIGRIEDNGETVHISLWGVPARIPQDSDVLGSSLAAGHLPITKTALRASVAALVSEEAPADLGFEEGYRTWRDAHGGVFTISVSEVVDVIFSTVRDGHGAPSK